MLWASKRSQSKSASSSANSFSFRRVQDLIKIAGVFTMEIIQRCNAVFKDCLYIINRHLKSLHKPVMHLIGHVGSQYLKGPPLIGLVKLQLIGGISCGASV